MVALKLYNNYAEMLTDDVNDVNIVVDNVSIVDIVVVEIDGHNVLTVLLMLLILGRRLKF